MKVGLRIVTDYLPIQASTVPCEHVFLSSGKMDTKRRNHINPLTMEALQMLKFHLRKERLNLTKGWTMSEKQMVNDTLDEDLLAGLLKGDFQDKLDNAVKSIMDKSASA